MIRLALMWLPAAFCPPQNHAARQFELHSIVNTHEQMKAVFSTAGVRKVTAATRGCSVSVYPLSTGAEGHGELALMTQSSSFLVWNTDSLSDLTEKEKLHLLTAAD